MIIRESATLAVSNARTINLDRGMNAYIHTCIHTYVHIYIYTYIHTYIHIQNTYIHTSIHPSIHPSIQHTYLLLLQCPRAQIPRNDADATAQPTAGWCLLGCCFVCFPRLSPHDTSEPDDSDHDRTLLLQLLLPLLPRTLGHPSGTAGPLNSPSGPSPDFGLCFAPLRLSVVGEREKACPRPAPDRHALLWSGLNTESGFSGRLRVWPGRRRRRDGPANSAFRHHPQQEEPVSIHTCM
jgi:hypothetical protein